jgi:long-chain acyl-CoA synthetase
MSPMERLHRVRADLVRPGGRFEIETTLIRGVATRTWKHAPCTLREVFERTVDFGEHEYLVFEQDRISYRAHHVNVCTLAHVLVDRFSVHKGDRVAIAMRNYPEYATIFWAAWSIGAIVVPLNSWWSGHELGFALRDCHPKVLFADGQRLDSLQPLLAELRLDDIICVRDTRPLTVSFAELTTGRSSVKQLPSVEIDADDAATILYTSGTTGQPKGALGTHRNACSTIWSTLFSLQSSKDLEGATEPDTTAQKTVLITTPLFHVIGCLSGLVNQTYLGSKVVLMCKWDAVTALGLVERERVSSITMVPAMWWQLIEVHARLCKDVSSLERLSYGGAPAPAELFVRLEQSFPNALVMTGFGMTETSSPSTHSFGDYLKRAPTSVGMPPPVCDIKAVDEHGVDVADGGLGELWIRGPNIVAGYWQRPEATAEAFDDGWIKSGDVGYLDEDGHVHIVDRLKDVVIRGGENIYCVEVENAIVAYGGIVEAAVIGLPHDILGEEVAAVVLVETGARVDEQALRVYLAGCLAAFKIPVAIEFRTADLPRNATGKVIKSVLRERFER